ncbi:MAG: hypothetical protein JWM36_3184 [Hyphomicrobiales bacterium]|nr:hypothetical protein [Hyphomicrobiales bacterium]
MANSEATPAASGSAPSKSSKGWLIALAIPLAYWGYSGFPSPGTLIHYWTDASSECVKFAEANRDKLFAGKSKIKAMESWLKNGKAVVELGGYNEGEDKYTPRLCVVGGGSIQIVSVFENGTWR